MDKRNTVLELFKQEMDNRRVRLHGAVLMSKHNVIEELYLPPYTEATMTRMYSSSKSVTAVAIGKLIGEGRLSLDDRIVDIFANRFDMTNVHPLLREQTVRHMLCMTTVYSTPTYSEANTDWLASYFRGEATHPAGTLWHYDSCGSYVLGAIVKHITGMDFVEYLRPEFDVMGISKNIYCLKGPDGEAWASSGVIASTSDIAKIAYLMLNRGKWGDKQLIPCDYASAAISSLVSNHERGIITRYCCGYGYQIWSHPNGAFAFRGLGGQVAIGFPGRDLVFACNCDTSSCATTYDDIFNAVEAIIIPYFPIINQAEYDNAQPKPIESCGLDRFLSVKYNIKPNRMQIQSAMFSKENDRYRLTYTQHGKEYSFEFTDKTEITALFPTAYTGEYLFSEKHFMNYRCSISAEWVDPRKLLLRIWAEDVYVGNLALFFYFCDDGRIAICAYKNAQFFFTDFNGFAYGKAEDS